MSHRSFFPLVASLAMAGCTAEVADEPEDVEDVEELGEDSGELGWHHGWGGDHGGKAKGAFTCDFRIAGDAFGPADIAPALERDRMIMSRAKGFRHKHLPIALDFENSTNGFTDLLSGGRYLFKSAKDAEKYRQFVEDEYTLDGVQFLDREYFFDAECYDFKVVGARSFTDLTTTQVILRTERFELSGKHAIKKVKKAWDDIEQEAEARGLAGAWLLYNKDENLASVVYFSDRVVPYDPNVPDFASLGYLAGAPALGHHLEDLGFARIFDRTHWVLTIWLPFVHGDNGEPSAWPHSPPFGLPFCGDGVCEVSRGEDDDSCAVDCPVKCGNGICQPYKGENDLNCPGDCGGTCY